jgi:hypothetical protein
VAGSASRKWSEATVTERLACDALAHRVLGWRLAPNRYLQAERTWIPRSRFRPLTDVRDALRLVDALTKDYSLIANPDGVTAEVRVAGRIGRATSRRRALAISLAVADAIGLELSLTDLSKHAGNVAAVRKGRAKSS